MERVTLFSYKLTNPFTGIKGPLSLSLFTFQYIHMPVYLYIYVICGYLSIYLSSFSSNSLCNQFPALTGEVATIDTIQLALCLLLKRFFYVEKGGLF